MARTVVPLRVAVVAVMEDDGEDAQEAEFGVDVHSHCVPLYWYPAKTETESLKNHSGFNMRNTGRLMVIKVQRFRQTLRSLNIHTEADTR